MTTNDECVICQAAIGPEDSGLCDAHKYDEQLARRREHSPAAPRVEGPGACRSCGCTDGDCSGCVERTGSPCWWVEADLCSACIADCPGCNVQMIGTGTVSHNEDGSHTWTPADVDDDERRDVLGEALDGLLRGSLADGLARIDVSIRQQLADTREEIRRLEETLLEATRDRDAAQRLVEQLWPTNLLRKTIADPFAVIAAIVHELGRPTGEWTAAVEVQSIGTDDGDQLVELVALHRTVAA